ncbi:MAG: TetR family transcriptional regulator [Alphaproteobacteria bacterium]|nr:TetR family transcriptional regulator [Alphaproteobacteria bacterium]
MSPPRGRPPTYDRDEALGRLLAAFWEKGYSTATLDDLVEATGMNRPSLYGAFGDKKAMYLAALDLFRGGMLQQMEHLLFGAARIEDALAALMEGALAVYFSGENGARGCVAICTATAEATLDPDIRERLHLVIQSIDEIVARRLERAIAEGQVPASLDPMRTARVLGSIVHSMAVRTRSGEARADLGALGRDAAAMVLAAGGVTAAARSLN